MLISVAVINSRSMNAKIRVTMSFDGITNNMIRIITWLLEEMILYLTPKEKFALNWKFV